MVLTHVVRSAHLSRALHSLCPRSPYSYTYHARFVIQDLIEKLLQYNRLSLSLLHPTVQLGPVVPPSAQDMLTRSSMPSTLQRWSALGTVPNPAQFIAA